MSQRAFKYISNSARPELVEGHGMGYFVGVRAGFDRLSPNGIYVSKVRK